MSSVIGATAVQRASHARNQPTAAFVRLESAGLVRLVHQIRGFNPNPSAPVRVMHETVARRHGRARYVHLMHRAAANVHDVHAKRLWGDR